MTGDVVALNTIAAPESDPRRSASIVNLDSNAPVKAIANFSLND